MLAASVFPSARSSRLREALRQSWGRESDRERDMVLIARYHRSLPSARNHVDDRTWQDLDMDGLFARIDRTVSAPGAQLLYHQMRSFEDDEQVLIERTRQHDLFRREVALREKIWTSFDTLKNPGAAWLAPLILNPAPESPRYAWLLYLSSFLTLGSLLGILFFPPLLVVTLLLFLGNVVINQTYGKTIMPHFPGFAQLANLLGLGETLAKMPNDHNLPQLQYLRATAPLMSRLRQRFGWFVGDRQGQGEIAEAIYNYLNLFFLFDILIFLRSLGSLRAHQDVLSRILHEVGSLDAAQSVASYLTGTRGTVVPELVAGRRIEVEGLCHPLIAVPVGNSLVVTDRSALVSGSNMAGKTTFIRTIGINLILSRTLHFCHAVRAVFPRAIVRSAIRRNDQLSEGQSYFFAELKQLHEFVDAGEGAALHLFLIDEIFRGTNTIERIAASTAVLKDLARCHMVLVTTHDIELTELLVADFDMYHFSEHFLEGKCAFDYRLLAGPARSRNAIKLLEFTGYPRRITDEATALAEKLSARSDWRI